MSTEPPDDPLPARTQPETPPGWYPAPDGAPTLRYWDGAAWTSNVAPMPPTQAQVVVRQAAQPRKYVTRGVSQTEHLMHLVLTVFTCGLWLPVWLLRMLAGKHRQVAKY